MKKFILILILISIASKSYAGFDAVGYITSVHLKDGRLKFGFSNRAADAYCKVGWGGLSFYILTTHEDYPYYYGLITSANVNKQKVRLANISVFDGSTACNITETGYGIQVYAPD